MADPHHRTKMVRSEPRRQPLVSRTANTDSEEHSAAGSAFLEGRPNNWDFSDWRPNHTFDASKRVKKGNPEREKEKEKEREYEQGLSHDSPPTSERKRTPSTFPRTRAPNTPKAERMAMENLRQRLQFSDYDEASTDGERNNERVVTVQKRRPPNFTHQDTSSAGDSENIPPASFLDSNQSTSRLSRFLLNSDLNAHASRPLENTARNAQPIDGALRNSKLNKDDELDSNQIVGRLMQVRDYIKQATGMMQSLNRSSDPSEHIKARKLEQVVRRLREQEQKYLDLLVQLSAVRSDPAPLGENSGENNNSNTDSASVDLDVKSETSEANTDMNDDEDCTPRPRIEDNLGIYSDEDEQPSMLSARSPNALRSELERTLVSENALGDAHTRNVDRTEQQTDLVNIQSDFDKKNEELEGLRQHHDLLLKMLNQQEQLKKLQDRQAELLDLQRHAEMRLAEQRALNNKVQSNVEGPLTGATAAAPLQTQTELEQQESWSDQDIVPSELKELRRKLDYLRNLHYEQNQEHGSQHELSSQPTEQSSEMSASSAHQNALQNKLSELQDKKSQIDGLIQELHGLREQRYFAIGDDMASSTSSTRHLIDSLQTTTSAGQTATEAQDLLQLLEAQKKLKKLQEVRGRLNQLRDLVQYYQTGNQFIHDSSLENDDDPMSNPESPLHQQSFSQQASTLEESIKQLVSSSKDAVFAQLRGSRKDSGSELLNEYFTVQQQSERQTGGEAYVQQTTADAEDGDEGDGDSSLGSSIASWGDPQTLDKLRKLKDAKEKLARLEALVTKIRASPNALAALTDEDLNEFTEGAEGLQQTNREDDARRDRSGRELQIPTAAAAQQLSDGEVTESTRALLEYEETMRDQKEELDHLTEERNKLLAIQQQLQALYDQLPVNEEGSKSGQNQNKDNTQVKVAADSVTFQEPLETVCHSDELYDKMRRERILQEELRDKKRQLENMMRKDKPRKQYSRNQDNRNQDNQSDKVSFSSKSDPFGASMFSGDVTMATWGGSTVDNIEEIEENENDSGAGQEADEEDDGYPSDGIVQVEEEEEEGNQDSDNTYTIEEDFRSRRAHGPDPAAADNTQSRFSRKRQTAPLVNPDSPRRRRSYNSWSVGWAPSAGSRRRSRPRQENYQSAEDIVREGEQHKRRGRSVTKNWQKRLQQQVDTLLDMQRSMMHEQRASSLGAVGGFYPDHYTASMQQHQQLMANIGQWYSALQQQMLALQLTNEQLQDRLRGQGDSAHHAGSQERLTPGVYNSYPASAAYPPPPPWGYPPLLSPFSPLPNMTFPPFSLNPRFPENFTMPSNPTELAGNSQVERRPHQTSSAPAQPPKGDMEARNAEGPSVRVEREFTSLSPRRDRPLMQHLLRDSQTGTEMSDSPQHINALASKLSSQNVNEGAIPKLNLEELLRSKAHRRLSQNNRTGGAPIHTDRVERADSDTAVIGRKYPTPRRAAAAARLAGQQKSPAGVSTSAEAYRPGLSADISGTAFLDHASMSSVMSISSMPGTAEAIDYVQAAQKQPTKTDSDAASEFTQFEALRETIYSEVATLISQNENRPNFLIELFREMQLLNNDYLRQRALYAIQELVAKYLLEEPKESIKVPPPPWVMKNEDTTTTSGVAGLSELTPSESLVTSDDEEVKYRLYAQNPHLTRQIIRHTTKKPSTVSPEELAQERFDYEEPVEESSTLSTPTSGNYWEHNPFANDSLGDTVIHLDKAMQRMRDYESKLSEGMRKGSIGESPSNTKQGAHMVSTLPEDGASGSAAANTQDEQSESSIPDFPNPQINTQELDRQIKAIMGRVIPVIKQQMGNQCSQSLLEYIMRLVVSLAQKDKSQAEGHEYVEFFHNQLAAILHKSLDKYEGRKMCECYEPLLTDISEVLFNELVFLRLMQDLDAPKAKFRSRMEKWRQDSLTSSETQSVTTQEENLAAAAAAEDEDEDGEEEDDDEDSSSSSEESEMQETGTASEESEEEAGEQRENDGDTDQENNSREKEESVNVTAAEEEELGKMRDDEMANQVDVSEGEEDDEMGSSSVMIQLAMSETKPFTRIGSDEDDEDEDETQSAEDPSETAVSRDAEMEKSRDDEDTNKMTEPCADNDDNKESSSVQDEDKDRDEVEDAAKNGELLENGDLTVDDLPAKLNVSDKEELELRLTSEQVSNDITEELLNSMDQGAELAGDGAALKEPEP